MCAHTKIRYLYKVFHKFSTFKWILEDLPACNYTSKMSEKKQIRITDIAKAAGLSAGTVDRVIHNRGKVSSKAKERVLQVMSELDYHPNIIARTLARNKLLKIGILIPEFEQDMYWKTIKKGIDTALQNVKHYGVEGLFFTYPQHDPIPFNAIADRLLGTKPDALLIAPIFNVQAKNFLARAKSKEIPVVLINTDIEDSTKLSFVGTNSYQSGVLAGRLFDPKKGTKLVVLHLEAQSQNASHLMAKETGLVDAIEKKNPEVKVITLIYDHFEDKRFLNEIIQALKKERNISGIFITSSRAYLVAEKIKDVFPGVKIIGFDLVDQNLQLLNQSAIEILINQNPKQQGYLGILSLVNHIVFNKAIPPVQFLPLDIVLQENATFYTERQNLVLTV